MSQDGEPPRKRVRKGTKSCWECKRRKVRCQLSTEDVPVCSGCLTRGTTCLSQEYPEERDPASGSNVGERLGRIEQVLEKLVAKIEQYEDEEHSAQKILTPDSSHNNDVLTPYSASATGGNGDGAPIMHMFENSLLGHTTTSQVSTPAPQTVKNSACIRTPKLERIRQALLELLPTQRETHLICEASCSWLLSFALAPTTGDQGAPSTPNLAEIAKMHPTQIAATVLYIAVCLQQLDPDFDTSQLRLYPTVEARMDKFVNVCQALVTSDDELVSTLYGLQCLTLQGVYHINAGNPRRSWLTFRRALSIGQLMGIHKPECTLKGARDMWSMIIRIDRYLALLLGLPAGSGDDTFGPDETFDNPEINKDALFSRKLTELSGRIIERNQSSNSQAYPNTQAIDESLEKLAKAMPEGYWDIPTKIPTERTIEAATTFDRIWTQIWFFQIEALTHLPFMLRASTERRFDYSKFTCLKASREMMTRYLALRNGEDKTFSCKVADFGALTACVTLFLGFLDPVQNSDSVHERQQRDSDRTLVQTVLKAMEEMSRKGRDVVATQSVNVIKSLMAVDDASGPNSGSLKLSIPYFGTISIVRPQPQAVQQAQLPSPPTSTTCNTSFTPQQQQHQLPSQPQNQQLPQQQSRIPFDQSAPTQIWPNYAFPSDPTQPMVSFQSSQFPPAQPELSIHDWALPEADTLFFDSLLNTDIEGNWIF